MKAHVYVWMKYTVLDPQGQTVCHALNSLGHKEVTSVRQGKYFEIDLADGTSKEKAAAALEEMHTATPAGNHGFVASGGPNRNRPPSDSGLSHT